METFRNGNSSSATGNCSDRNWFRLLMSLLMSPIRPSGTYLITGGTGALGMQTAAWLVERGVRSLVLVGRRPPNDESLAEIAKLEAAGCRVMLRQIDVGIRKQFEKVVQEIAEQSPPLKGIVHAAGVLDERLLVQNDWSNFEKVLSPKIAGAWNLHELTANLQLEAFICFSSVASVIGTFKQASYAMGNAFLDGLAQLRRSQGRAALSVGWGPWDGKGMADRDDVRRTVPLIGINFLTANTSFARLENLLNAKLAHALVVDINWRQLAQVLPAMREMLPETLPENRLLPPKPTYDTPDSRQALLLEKLRVAPRKKIERH